jgi:hypothetical protein
MIGSCMCEASVHLLKQKDRYFWRSLFPKANGEQRLHVIAEPITRQAGLTEDRVVGGLITLF